MGRRSRRPSLVRLVPYGGSGATEVSGSLALALDVGPPRRGPARAPLGVVRDVRPSGSRPAAWTIAQLVFDLLAGVRPYHHLAGYTTPKLFERLQPLSGRLPGPPPALSTVRVCEPCPDVAEVAAVARTRVRVQALALRLEYDRRWRCAAIETTVPA